MENLPSDGAEVRVGTRGSVISGVPGIPPVFPLYFRLGPANET